MLLLMTSTQRYVKGSPARLKDDKNLNPLSIFIPECPEGYKYDSASESCRKIHTGSEEEYSY